MQIAEVLKEFSMFLISRTDKILNRRFEALKKKGVGGMGCSRIYMSGEDVCRNKVNGNCISLCK